MLIGSSVPIFTENRRQGLRTVVYRKQNTNMLTPPSPSLLSILYLEIHNVFFRLRVPKGSRD